SLMMAMPTVAGASGASKSSPSGTAVGFRPPFLNASVSNYSLSWYAPQPCASTKVLSPSPSFNSTTGKFALRISTTDRGCHGGGVSHLETRLGVATSPVRLSLNGLHVVRFFYLLEWSVKLTAVSPGSNPSQAQTWFFLTNDVQDQTSGSMWTQSGMYYNTSSTTSGNQTFVHTYITKISFPVLVPFTRHDVYVFDLDFDVNVDGYASAAPHAYAFAELSLGTAAGGTKVPLIAIH
ncbi:MAG: hypothetical protein L3K09_07300, partial [Thermoplasmata archaeon]|nr:hypothetical protein [Thermoplasmata archaeon]